MYDKMFDLMTKMYNNMKDIKTDVQSINNRLINSDRINITEKLT